MILVLLPPSQSAHKRAQLVFILHFLFCMTNILTYQSDGRVIRKHQETGSCWLALDRVGHKLTKQCPICGIALTGGDKVKQHYQACHRNHKGIKKINICVL